MMRNDVVSAGLPPSSGPTQSPNAEARPGSYSGRVRYDQEGSSSYERRQKPSTHRIESSLVLRAFTLIPKIHRVLDIPCGGGRMTLLLAQEGYRVTAADLSPSMVTLAGEKFKRLGLTCQVLSLDIEAMAVAAGAYDTVLCFRLFHHFPDRSIRQRVVRELCRVARSCVVLSYFAYWAWTPMVRRARRALFGKKIKKHSTTRREVEGYFEDAGFRLVKDLVHVPFFSTLHLAVFERIVGR